MSLGDSLGLAALVVGIVGFAVAIWQVKLARDEIEHAVTVATATREAVSKTERLATLLELMRAIPRMQRLERDLNELIRDDRSSPAVERLQEWRELAAETRGLLKVHGYHAGALVVRLEDSSNSAAQAINDLETKDLATATKSVTTMIANATEDATVLMGELRGRPSEEAGAGT